MVNEPDEKCLHGEKKRKKSTSTTNHNSTNLGQTTQESLKVLSEEIEEVVNVYEQRLNDERLVPYKKKTASVRHNLRYKSIPYKNKIKIPFTIRQRIQ